MAQNPAEIFVLSHCLLNASTRVKGIRRPIPFDTKGKQIIQLPCPEILFGGVRREKKTKEDYDMKEYRELCQDLFKPYANMIEMLAKDGHAVLITGVSKSPSCGVLKTTVRSENSKEENQVIFGKGVFTEEIEKELKRRNILYSVTEWEK